MSSPNEEQVPEAGPGPAHEVDENDSPVAQAIEAFLLWGLRNILTLYFPNAPPEVVNLIDVFIKYILIPFIAMRVFH